MSAETYAARPMPTTVAETFTLCAQLAREVADNPDTKWVATVALHRLAGYIEQAAQAAGRKPMNVWPETCTHEPVCLDERDCDARQREYGSDWQHDDAAEGRWEK